MKTINFLLFVCLTQMSARADDEMNIALHRVTASEIAAAMSMESGYDIRATSNVARFHANVIFRLARSLCLPESAGTRLYIHHRDWLQAYLTTSGLSYETAPSFTRLANEARQDQIIEYFPGQVVRKVEKGSGPLLALNILVFWTEYDNSEDHYTFDDTLASPRLRIRNDRVLTYRLLDFGDMVVYHEITGLYGRPTSGVLGVLFGILGDARIVHSRFIQRPDGCLFARTRAVKGILRANPVVTVGPTGEMKKGVVDDRPGRAKIMSRLDAPLEISYGPQLTEKDALAVMRGLAVNSP